MNVGKKLFTNVGGKNKSRQLIKNMIRRLMKNMIPTNGGLKVCVAMRTAVASYIVYMYPEAII